MPPLTGFFILWIAVLQIFRAYGAAVGRALLPQRLLIWAAEHRRPTAQNYFRVVRIFRGCPASQHLPARRLDALAVDPIAIVGEQRIDHARDVIGLAHAAQRDVRLHHFLELRIVPDEAAAEIRFCSARGHDVDADFARAKFLGHVAGESFDGGFQRRVNRVARQHKPAGAGGDVDDVPAVVDERQQGLREEKDGFEMDVGHLVELRLGGFGERLREADAGGVDEEIKFRRGEFFERGLGDGGEVQVGIARGDVQLHGHGVRAERLDLFHHFAGLGLRGFVGDDGDFVAH